MIDWPAHKGKWIPVEWVKPAVGQHIVAKFANGSTWSGAYQGAKQAFVAWMPLPD